MVKRILPLVILLSTVAFSYSYAAAPKEETPPPQTLSAEDIASFEKKFREIDVYMNFFKEKMVEHDDIILLYTEAERQFRDLKTSPDISDIKLAKEYLNTKIDILDNKAKQKVSYIKRMELMYQTMVIMGLGIIVYMSIYSIYMYIRRK